jgi:hypothetical protein
MADAATPRSARTSNTSHTPVMAMLRSSCLRYVSSCLSRGFSATFFRACSIQSGDAKPAWRTSDSPSPPYPMMPTRSFRLGGCEMAFGMIAGPLSATPSSAMMAWRFVSSTARFRRKL